MMKNREFDKYFQSMEWYFWRFSLTWWKNPGHKYMETKENDRSLIPAMALFLPPGQLGLCLAMAEDNVQPTSVPPGPQLASTTSTWQCCALRTGKARPAWGGVHGQETRKISVCWASCVAATLLLPLPWPGQLLTHLASAAANRCLYCY